jgi:hypothetical protein
MCVYIYTHTHTHRQTLSLEEETSIKLEHMALDRQVKKMSDGNEALELALQEAKMLKLIPLQVINIYTHT